MIVSGRVDVGFYKVGNKKVWVKCYRPRAAETIPVCFFIAFFFFVGGVDFETQHIWVNMGKLSY